MRTDLVPVYLDAQSFKDAHAQARVDAEVEARLKLGLEKSLGARLHDEAKRRLVLDSTLRGMAWLAAMCEEFEIEPRTLLEPPDDICHQTFTNTRSLRFDRRAIEVGVGAGYYTGLLVGLKAGGVK